MYSRPKTAQRWGAGTPVTFLFQRLWRFVTRRWREEQTLPLPEAGYSGWRRVHLNVLGHSGVWWSPLLDQGSQTLWATRDRQAGSILKWTHTHTHTIHYMFTASMKKCHNNLNMTTSVFRNTDNILLTLTSLMIMKIYKYKFIIILIIVLLKTGMLLL